MKTKNILLTGAATMALLAGCSLDYEPLDRYSDITEGSASDTTSVALKDKQAVLDQMQNINNKWRDEQEAWYLDKLLLADSHSDNAYAGSPSAETTPFEVNSIEGSNTNLYRDWNVYMTNVAAANILIQNIDGVPDASLTTAERALYKAQAKLFRAMVYFDMVRIWGNVPLITTVAGDITSETIEDVYPAYFPPQTDELTVYQQIEKDLLEAVQDAPATDPSDKSLLSKDVGYALLAKLYAEKPLRDYDKVIQYADQLAADGYALEPRFGDLFGVICADPTQPAGPSNFATAPTLRNSVESIYEAHFDAANANWASWMFGRCLENWNFYFEWAKWITPSRDLVKAFTSEAQTDLRYAESVVWYSCGWNIYYPADNYAFMYKDRSGYNSIIKYRYADILLLKAEALILGKNDLAGAAAIINRTRARAGLDPLPSSVTSNRQSLFNAYLKERRLELAFEGQRWFDLTRLDLVEEVLNNVVDEGRPALVYPYDTNSYRLPIPQNILDQNPNLVQNPGY
ncbi:MAG: RagB/SusD family nutrient uptake outer membrane protein [Prevotellaceae bacterium]|jgi:hypothetical protein|nr:RagB/SusD family nutrient uptake outer membrane protein [Prevotellaceae bacterium]